MSDRTRPFRDHERLMVELHAVKQELRETQLRSGRALLLLLAFVESIDDGVDLNACCLVLHTADAGCTCLVCAARAVLAEGAA